MYERLRESEKERVQPVKKSFISNLLIFRSLLHHRQNTAHVQTKKLDPVPEHMMPHLPANYHHAAHARIDKCFN